jgi:hypothetical protein
VIRRGLLGVALLLLSCAKSAPPDASDTKPAAPAPNTADAASKPVTSPKPRSVRVKAAMPAAGLTAGERLTLPHAFDVPADGTLTLDFEHGARVELRGESHALADQPLRAEPNQRDELMIQQGSVSVDLPPSAPTPSSGFMLYTPSAVLGLVRGGRYAVRVFADGSAQGYVVSGSISLDAAGRTPSPGEGALLLGAGDGFALRVDGTLKRIPHRAATLEDAAQLSRALRPATASGTAQPELERLLTQRMAAVRPKWELQRSLSAQHRERARAKSPEAEGLQRELAENAALLSRERAKLRLCLGQRAAARLVPSASDTDAQSREAREMLER